MVKQMHCLENHLIEWTRVAIDGEICHKHRELREPIGAFAGQVIVQHLIHATHDLLSGQPGLEAGVTRGTRQVIVVRCFGHRVRPTVGARDDPAHQQRLLELLALALVFLRLEAVPRLGLLFEELLAHLLRQLVQLLGRHRTHVDIGGDHVLDFLVNECLVVVIGGVVAVIDIDFTHSVDK